MKPASRAPGANAPSDAETTWRRKLASEGDAQARAITEGLRNDGEALNFMQSKLRDTQFRGRVKSSVSGLTADTAETRNWHQWLESLSGDDLCDILVWCSVERLGAKRVIEGSMSRSAYSVALWLNSEAKVGLRNFLEGIPEWNEFNPGDSSGELKLDVEHLSNYLKEDEINLLAVCFKNMGDKGREMFLSFCKIEKKFDKLRAEADKYALDFWR